MASNPIPASDSEFELRATGEDLAIEGLGGGGGGESGAGTWVENAHLNVATMDSSGPGPTLTGLHKISISTPRREEGKRSALEGETEHGLHVADDAMDGGVDRAARWIRDD